MFLKIPAVVLACLVQQGCNQNHLLWISDYSIGNCFEIYTNSLLPKEYKITTDTENRFTICNKECYIINKDIFKANSVRIDCSQ